jgi:hypothetical protein
MELIDRYVHAVGQHLPARSRADVEAELRSLLTESLDERAAAAGTQPTEALARDVIREFGPPREVASRYNPQPQYLIGPTLYPVYLTVLKIQLVVVAGISLFVLITGLSRHPGETRSFFEVVLRAGETLFGAVVDTWGVTTLIFALIELAVRHKTDGPAAWDPDRLPPVQDPDRVSFVGTVVSLYLLATVAAIFNFFPQWVGVLAVNDDGGRVVSLLEPGFRQYLPFLNAWWAAAFVLDVIVLRHGSWRRATRWAEVGLDLASAMIAGAIVLGPPVFRYDHFVKLGIGVVLALAVVRAGVRTYRLLRAVPAREPWQAR